MRTQTVTAEEDIAVRARHLLQSMRHPAVAPFLADWPGAYRGREVAAAALPATRWLGELGAGDAIYDADLVSALRKAAATLAWRQTYKAADLDPAFLQNYCWSEIVGTVGPFESERIACGFLILGPATLYPAHRHAAEELYVPLSGTAAWQQGDGVWRDQPPGTPIHHRSQEPHAMRTRAAPLLALYVWRGAGLTDKARLDAGHADTPIAPHPPVSQ